MVEATEDAQAPTRWAGLAVLVAAVALDRRFLGSALSRGEYVYDPFRIACLDLGRAAVFAAGLALLFPPFARRVPRWLARAALVPAAAGIALGAYGFGRWSEWIRPPVKSPDELAAWLTTDSAPWFGTAELRWRAAAYERTAPERVRERLGLALLVAEQYLRHGRAPEALRTLEQAIAEARTGGLVAGDLRAAQRALGIAHLRSGEVAHCVAMHDPASCLYPILPDGVWDDPTHARAAMAAFAESVAGLAPGKGVGARWLWHVASQVAGDPSGEAPVPGGLADDRAPGNASDIPVEPFEDVAAERGLTDVNLVGGAILDDFDGDGHLDLVTSTYHPNEGLRYYKNRGDGSFEDRSQASGLASVRGGFNLVQTDFDGDGRLDVFVLRGAWMRSYGRQVNSLLHQLPDGTFEDVTERSGLGSHAYPNLSAAWADFDLDGDLDLAVANERLSPARRLPPTLFRNEGDGTFAEVGAAAGLTARGDAKGLAWGDCDNDGLPDLYISNFDGPNRLYVNRGDGTFDERGRPAGVDRSPPHDRTFATWFFDYDNDGWEDLFVAGYGTSYLDEAVSGSFGPPADVERLRLFRNTGGGRFEDVSEALGFDRLLLPMGANYGDFDGDGWLDVYLGTGAPGFEFLLPNVLLRNVRGERFVDVTAAAGMGHLQKGHAIAFGDIDGDGDRDVFAQMGGWYPADRFANALFDNPGHGNHWLTLRLSGVRSNRAAIGARAAAIVVEEDGSTRTIRATVSSGGSFGASCLRVELGLGRAVRVRELEILWPASGTRQSFADVPMDRVLAIEELAVEYRVLEPNPPRADGR